MGENNIYNKHYPHIYSSAQTSPETWTTPVTEGKGLTIWPHATFEWKLIFDVIQEFISFLHDIFLLFILSVSLVSVFLWC